MSDSDIAMVDSDNGGGTAGEPDSSKHQTATSAAGPPREGSLLRLVQWQAAPSLLFTGKTNIDVQVWWCVSVITAPEDHLRFVSSYCMTLYYVGMYMLPFYTVRYLYSTGKT